MGRLETLLLHYVSDARTKRSLFSCKSKESRHRPLTHLSKGLLGFRMHAIVQIHCAQIQI